MSADRVRRLFVAWRRPDGLIVPIGCLTQRLSSGGTVFRFEYLKRAEGEPDFPRLPGFNNLHRAYEATSLFAVFANRVMPRERADYGAFVEQLDLSTEADPFEVLGRSEGVKTTDRIEVFPAPERSGAGDLTTLFFARGIRHLTDASAAVEGLREGDQLTLEPQRHNDVNPHAMLLNTRTGDSVGWAPDYLLDLLHELEALNGAPPTITVEHVNPPSVAPHLRLLCRATAAWPSGYQPFSGPQFHSLAPAE